MAKVIAVHEIIRPNGVIKPGNSFQSTGEELEQLKAAGAVKYDNSDAEDAEVKEPVDNSQGDAAPAKTSKAAAKAKASDKDLV